MNSGGCPVMSPRPGWDKRTESDHPWHVLFSEWDVPRSLQCKTQLEAASAVFGYLQMYNARDPGSTHLSQFQIIHESNLCEPTERDSLALDQAIEGTYGTTGRMPSSGIDVARGYKSE